MPLLTTTWLLDGEEEEGGWRRGKGGRGRRSFLSAAAAAAAYASANASAADASSSAVVLPAPVNGPAAAAASHRRRPRPQINQRAAKFRCRWRRGRLSCHHIMGEHARPRRYATRSTDGPLLVAFLMPLPASKTILELCVNKYTLYMFTKKHGACLNSSFSFLVATLRLVSGIRLNSNAHGVRKKRGDIG